MVRLRRHSSHFDVELPAGDEFVVRIAEKPGRWMSAAELDAMVADARHVLSRAVPGGDLEYGIFTGDPERLATCVLTIVRERSTKRPVAFNAIALLPVTLRGREEEVLHLGLTIVDPDYRSRGLSWVVYGLTVLLVCAHRQLRPLWISNVTQVPSAFGMVADSFENVFPSPHPGTRRSYEHLAIARHIMRYHRHVFGVGPEAHFDQGRFVIENSYTGGSDNLKKTWDEAPKHRDEIHNEMCRAQLDYDRGDDFLQIGQFTLGAQQRFLLRSVPPRSLPAVLSNVAFLFAGSLLLPVLHWFSPGRPLGELRPWKG